MKTSPAEIVREYGPFPGVEHVHGVTFDGRYVWFACGDKLHALDPESGAVVGAIAVGADAGTASDGKHLFQIAKDRILKIDPHTGRVVATIPAPGGSGDNSGLAWAEGALWVGQHRGRKIHQVNPGLGIDLMDFAAAVLPYPARAFGPGKTGIVAAPAGRRDRRHDAAGVRIDLQDAIFGDLKEVLAVRGGPGIGADRDRADYSTALGVERVQLVAAGEPHIATVKRHAMHVFDPRKGAVFAHNFGGRCLHAAALAARQRARE